MITLIFIAVLYLFFLGSRESAPKTMSETQRIINERKAVSKPSINDWEKGYLCGLDFAFQSIKIWFEDVID